jgi:hypothetical protein
LATFVHIFDARNSKKIIRDGIRPIRMLSRVKGVFCVPVVPDFQTTFQWLRELKRHGYRTASAVQFRIPDSEQVSVGRFAKPHSKMTAAEAIAFFREAKDARGLEVVIMRKIEPQEITRIRSVPQITGWRYYPEAKGKHPLWPGKGAINASRLRQVVIARNRSPLESLIDHDPISGT